MGKLEKLVNHSPPASDLQAFLRFSEHPKWVYYVGKPIENVVCVAQIKSTNGKRLFGQIRKLTHASHKLCRGSNDQW